MTFPPRTPGTAPPRCAYSGTVTPLRFARPHAVVLVLSAVLAAGGAGAEGVDWAKIGESEIVEILSHNDDGELHETQTWIVVVDDVGYVRSTNRRLFANIERDPEVALRVDGREIRLHAAMNEDPAVAEGVAQAHLNKYPDCVICKLFQFRTPRIVALSERP